MTNKLKVVQFSEHDFNFIVNKVKTYWMPWRKNQSCDSTLVLRNTVRVSVCLILILTACFIGIQDVYTHGPKINSWHMTKTAISDLFSFVEQKCSFQFGLINHAALLQRTSLFSLLKVVANIPKMTVLNFVSQASPQPQDGSCKLYTGHTGAGVAGVSGANLYIVHRPQTSTGVHRHELIIVNCKNSSKML